MPKPIVPIFAHGNVSLISQNFSPKLLIAPVIPQNKSRRVHLQLSGIAG